MLENKKNIAWVPFFSLNHLKVSKWPLQIALRKQVNVFFDVCFSMDIKSLLSQIF